MANRTKQLGGVGTKSALSTASLGKTASRGQRDKFVASAKSTKIQNETFSDTETDESEEEIEERRQATSDLPPEYWTIQKLVKYLSGGNQTATVIALCSLRDFDLSSDICQFAIRDVGGLEVLVNLLETDDIKCKIGALHILKDICASPAIKRAIADTGAMTPMVALLADENETLRCLAALTIANCAADARNRRTVRHAGGIEKLVALLQCPPQVARCGALALCSCSKSAKNKARMIQAGAVPLLAELLHSDNVELLLPVVGILEECARLPEHRAMVRQAGMLPDLVAHLRRPDVDLQTRCASALFKCAEDLEACDIIKQQDGLAPLVALLANAGNHDLIWGATGTLWRCAARRDIVSTLADMKVIETLVGLLTGQAEDVQVTVAGALAALAVDEKCRKAIRSSGGIDPLVRLLSGTNHALLTNTTTALGRCAQDPDSMAIIDKLDGVRLLWSLLKSPSPETQACAAWAISPCIENARDAGEMVRSFVGGLELIVGLLRSPHVTVQASVCSAIANIARDEENLAVLSDHGVVPLLGGLAPSQDLTLRRHLADAIAQCCAWGANRRAFGEAGAVEPLVRYLKCADPAVHRATARALCELSRDAENCVAMHNAGAVRLLLDMVGSDDEVLQEAAASCIGNIRQLALRAERAKLSKTN